MTGKDEIEKQKIREDIVQEIREKFPDVKWPTPISEPIFYGRFDKTPVMRRNLILDKTTGNQFDIVSDSYETIYHEEVLSNLLKAIPEEFGKPEIRTMMFKGGARATFFAKFPELRQFEIEGSETEVEYRLKNSYDRSSYLNYSAGLNELICTNGLRAFKSKERESAKHIGQTISNFHLKDRLKASLVDISDSHKLWLQWAKMRISEAEKIKVVEALPYSENEQERLLELPLINHSGVSLKDMKEPTMWSVFSAATQFVHEIKSEERKFDIEEKVPDILKRAASKITG